MSGLRFILVPWHPCNGLAQGLLPSAIRQQSRLLPQSHDPTWPALNRLLICSPRNPVITGKSDQLLDVAIVVVPELDRIGEVEWAPRSHCA
jgi:hypothetical protein